MTAVATAAEPDDDADDEWNGIDEIRLVYLLMFSRECNACTPDPDSDWLVRNRYCTPMGFNESGKMEYMLTTRGIEVVETAFAAARNRARDIVESGE